MDKKEAIPEISSQEFQAELLRCCEQQDKIIECYQLLLEYNKKAEEINRKKRKQLFIDSVILILWLIWGTSSFSKTMPSQKYVSANLRHRKKHKKPPTTSRKRALAVL